MAEHSTVGADSSKTGVQTASQVSPADPRALGLAAFATTTFVFGLSFTTIWDANVTAGVIALALAYGGAVQILAGIWAFARRLTFDATTFCSYGAFYLAYFFFTRSIAPNLPGSDVSDALAVFLLAWLIFTAYVLVAAADVSRALLVVYFFWTLTYLLLVIGYFQQSTNVVIAGGAAGIASAAAAWYCSCASLLKHTSGHDLSQLLASRIRRG
jgi:hypothetical protein